MDFITLYFFAYYVFPYKNVLLWYCYGLLPLIGYLFFMIVFYLVFVFR